MKTLSFRRLLFALSLAVFTLPATAQGVVVVAGGGREGDQGDTANRVQITFSLPGALKPEQFTINNEPSTPAPQRLSAARA